LLKAARGVRRNRMRGGEGEKSVGGRLMGSLDGRGDRTLGRRDMSFDGGWSCRSSVRLPSNTGMLTSVMDSCRDGPAD
jgi:hypothetical protein